MMNIRTIMIADEEYPKNLRTISGPPETLYVRGSLCEQDAIAVALVGSRRSSIYGAQTCEHLAYDLAAMGITVVSGMALGIDTAAHRGALKAHGRTIAVLGSGHGRVYPPENKKLYEEICEKGAVLTEFPDDTPPLRQNFPMRNRIISGLSLGVVVVEASRSSGALITAQLALEQGRDVFAVPGKINSATSVGTHGLIKDGARLVQSADDIIEELGIVPVGRDGTARAADASSAAVSLSDGERAVYELVSDEPVHIDEIAERTRLDTAQIAQIVLGLELKKLITQLPGQQYVAHKR